MWAANISAVFVFWSPLQFIKLLCLTYNLKPVLQTTNGRTGVGVEKETEGGNNLQMKNNPFRSNAISGRSDGQTQLQSCRAVSPPPSCSNKDGTEWSTEKSRAETDGAQTKGGARNREVRMQGWRQELENWFWWVWRGQGGCWIFQWYSWFGS